MHDAHTKALELIERCRELARENQAQERLDLALSIASFHPNCIDVQEELGFSYWFNGQKQESVDALRRSIQLGNDLSCPLIIFGHWLAELGYFDELEAHLRACWRRHPDELTYPRELAYYLMRFGATDRGAAVFRELLDRHPTDSPSVSRFVTMLASAERWDEAFETLDSFGPGVMSVSEYRSQRGALFAESGRRASAEQEWRHSLELEGKAETEIDETLAEWSEYWFEGGMEREEAEWKANQEMDPS